MRIVYLSLALLLLVSAQHVHAHGGQRCTIEGFVGIRHSSPNSMKLARLEINEPNGTLITNIIGCTAAQKAGLQPLDYLYAVDGKKATADTQFFCLLEDVAPGETVELGYIRQGKRRTVKLTLGKRTDACSEETPYPARGYFGLNSGSTDRHPGVRIDVIPDGPAAQAGLQDGDRLLAINGYAVGDWDDISTVKRVLTGDDLRYLVDRKGELLTLTGKLGEQQPDRHRWYDSYHYSYSDDCPDDVLIDLDFDEIEEKIERSIESIDWDAIEQDTENSVETAMESVREALASLRGRSRSEQVLDPEELDARVETVSADDASLRELREQVRMPQDNSLVVNNFSASPNPSDGRIKLSFMLPNRANTTIAVYAASGREVYRYDLGPFSGTFADELDIMRNGAGTYFLVVQQDERMFLRKLILAAR